LWEKGIEHHTSPAYTPQFQGKVERKNRTVGGQAHAMRVGAGLGEQFWELAWDCAVFLRNRSPTVSNLGGMTPFEAMYGRKPDLHMLRVFGCRAEALVPKQLRNKGADRTVSGIFVGYDSNTKSFKFLPDGARKWVAVRTLACEEHIGSRLVGGGQGVQGVGKTLLVAAQEGQRQGEPQQELEEKEDVDDDERIEYEAQSKGEGRAKMVAAKELPMMTREKLKKGLKERYANEMAMVGVGVDDFGAEIFGGEGIQQRVPKSVGEALRGDEREQWSKAIEEEVRSMEDAEVWGPPVEVQRGVKVTPLRFVFARKLGPDGEVERFKARLIFQNRDDGEEDNEDVYAPVVDKASLRMFLSQVAKHGWFLEQSDIKTAFLNAENVGEDYVRLPGCVVRDGESPVRKLQKALYGLRRAPKAWNTTFTAWALGHGFNQLKSEECIFVHTRLEAVLAVYVDDLLVAARVESGLREVQRLIEERFTVRHMGVPVYFLGMNVCYDREQRKIKLDQHTYVQALLDQYREHLKGPRTLPMGCGVQLNREQGEVNPTELPYSSLVGSLLYLAVCTRPEISFAVGTLSKFVAAPGEQHWSAAIDILGYLGATRMSGILLGEVQSGVQKGVLAYTDSDWANDTDDRKSVSGGAVFLDGNLVAWFSRKQNVVCTSSAEAEIHAMMEVLNVVRGVGGLVDELDGIFVSRKKGIPIILTDNQPGIDAVRARKAKRKHYDVKVKHLADSIEKGEFKLQKVATAVNVADIFTKALRAVRFRSLARFFVAEC
jgi:hypothetical protein